MFLGHIYNMGSLRLLRHLTNYHVANNNSFFLPVSRVPSIVCPVFKSVTSGRRYSLKSEKITNLRDNIKDGPGLKEFIAGTETLADGINVEEESVPYISDVESTRGHGRKVYFDVYGCQMNVNDTEVVWSILKSAGFLKTDDIKDADVILVVTCAIREGAETKVWNKLELLKGLKRVRAKRKDRLPLKIGVLGCMAERLKERLVEQERAVDLVAGPDAYKDLPRLLALTRRGQTAVNVLLSLDETYADVVPVRLNEDAVTAFVSIMRGCDNMCTYCIVPFTRGRERSRPIRSVLEEVRQLADAGVKEVTLLGQNVNSYRDLSETQHFGGLPPEEETHLARGFKTVYRPKRGGLRFADLLDKVSSVDPEMRIRFTSPHPKDFPDEVLQLIGERANVCRSLHLPAQSGNNAVLERMRRGYTRRAYLDLVARARDTLPDVALSSDFICGFCGETDAEFQDTLTLIEEVKYHMAFLFPYSLREKTAAHRRYQDDVPKAVKHERLQAMVSLYRREAEKLYKQRIGHQDLVLVEGVSKRSDRCLAGRNDANIKVIFPAEDIPVGAHTNVTRPVQPGDYVVVEITEASSQVMKGVAVHHTTLTEFYNAADRQQLTCPL